MTTQPATLHPMRRWRKLHGLTLAQVADQAGVCIQAVSNYERRLSTPSGQMVRRLVHTTEAIRPGHGLTAGQILELEPYEPADQDIAQTGDREAA